MSNQPIGTVSAAVANVRNGPGTHFDVIAQVKQGAMLTLVGQSGDGAWLQVCCVAGQVGWLWAELLVIEGSTRALPQVQAPPAALASPPRRQPRRCAGVADRSASRTGRGCWRPGHGSAAAGSLPAP
ncbi:MAG: SH3 domain-containing protein [Caldilineales bacterium]|nr:SH3 domain-containing protein [Caldilineales bacterium]